MILTARCMDLLDGTTTNIAAANIAKDLQSSTTQLQWIVGAYSLSFVVGLIAGARLGDIFGRRRLSLIGVIAFVGCALSPTSDVLIAFRLAQGFAAALLIPQDLGLLRTVFAPNELAKRSVFGPVWWTGVRVGAGGRRLRRRRRGRDGQLLPGARPVCRGLGGRGAE